MTRTITYRRAGGADAGAIASLFRSTRHACMPYLPVLHTPEEDAAFFSERVLPNDTVWAALHAGRIVGFCAYSRGWLNHLYVEPAFQRSGVGSELLAFAIAENELLDLWVFQENAAAIAFYESRGFRLLERTDGSENEERVPDALYRLAGA